MIARYSSLCPMCGVYIAKNVSRVAKLPRPIPVQVDRWTLRLREGWGTDRGYYDPAGDRQLRAWVHERCYSAGLEVARPVERAPARPLAPPPAPEPITPELAAFRERMRIANEADERRRAERVAAARARTDGD